MRYCREERDKFEDEAKAYATMEPFHYIPEKRSTEHGSYIIEALETGRVYRGHFNVVNNGCITNLPDDAVVEVPGYIDGNGIAIPQVRGSSLGLRSYLQPKCLCATSGR